jgi:hypothetical protein
MDIDHKGSQGHTQMAVVLQGEEVPLFDLDTNWYFISWSCTKTAQNVKQGIILSEISGSHGDE